MKIDTTSFDLAQQNMDYDERLLTQVSESVSTYRMYQWKNCGITISKNKHDLLNTLTCDKGVRLTGGGAVFHSPGDIVFSLASHKNNPQFSGSFKQKLNNITTWIESGLKEIGVILEPSPKKTNTNIAFCTQYPSEFERFYQHQKTLAVAMRRFKDKWMVQGVIHTITAPEWNTLLPKEMHAYLTSGLGIPINLIDLTQKMKNILVQNTDT